MDPKMRLPSGMALEKLLATRWAQLVYHLRFVRNFFEMVGSSWIIAIPNPSGRGSLCLQDIFLDDSGVF